MGKNEFESTHQIVDLGLKKKNLRITNDGELTSSEPKEGEVFINNYWEIMSGCNCDVCNANRKQRDKSIQKTKGGG